MNFYQPQAFWLLSLLIVPIIIHLFQFRRYKKLLFSNVAFLKKVDEEKKQNRKLKHLLILLSRLLFLTFFIICLAQPFLDREEKFADVSLGIIDNSASNLTIPEGNSNTVLEDHMDIVNKLSERYSDLQIKVIDATGNDVQAFEIPEVNSSLTSFNLKELMSTQKISKQLILFSDFQKNVIDDNMDLLRDTTVDIVLVPVHKEVPKTVVWDSIWIKNQSGLATNDKLMINVYSRSGKLGTDISIIENDQYVGNSAVELNESINSLNFSLPIQSTDLDRSLVLKTDEQSSIYDNEFFISLSQQKALKTLYLFNKNPNDYIKSLFSGNELFDYQQSNIANYSFQALEQYDFLVAELGGTLSSQSLMLLRQFAQQGGTLVLIPSEDFVDLNELEKFGVIDAKRRNIDEKVELSNPDFNNPFFNNVFKNKEELIDMPVAKPLINWRQGNNLLSFKDGSPFLSVVESNIYLFSTELTEAYTDFPKTAIFLPVFYKMAFSNQGESSVHYHYLDEELVDLSYMRISNGVIIKLANNGKALIPDQREKGSGKEIIIPKGELEPGFYNVLNAKTDSIYGHLALNYPKEESKEGFYTIAELNTLFSDQPNVKVINEPGFDKLNEYITESKEGFPLWKYFLILALLSLLAEVLIIRFYK
ncbi:BatA and WFA domain-containing protein [Marivirga atlantica]|uniref:BatA domain-containing protein n=1 Tax=Marivirga atlantica TaxID=1548457 RepID=A0A937A7F0_9BACT|nr:BatA domain-containing protein [Marivirga atlantica]MBL0764995.1 BatA domain-containing protein [Marivirga atlantica]